MGASPAPTGPVREICTAFPIRTAREKPITGSKGELPGMFCRAGILLLSNMYAERVRNAFRNLSAYDSRLPIYCTPILHSRLITERPGGPGGAPLSVDPARSLKPLFLEEEDQVADPV